MKRLVITAALLLLCISHTLSLTAANVEEEGRAWLAAQKDPAAINVNGTWDSEEWGVLHLTQTGGSRDVGGRGGGYDITGVVSGKSLFMLFSSNRTVQYCAILTSEGDNGLGGSYFNRRSRLKKGLCQEKSRPMSMTKK